MVEQLLRTTDVHTIYLLVRGKRGLPAQDRIARLLNSGLFHMVRDKPELLAKVRSVACGRLIVERGGAWGGGGPCPMLVECGGVGYGLGSD